MIGNQKLYTHDTAISIGKAMLIKSVSSGLRPLSVIPAYAKEPTSPAPPVPEDQAAIAYLKKKENLLIDTYSYQMQKIM